jgi:hypothetical protein
MRILRVHSAVRMRMVFDTSGAYFKRLTSITCTRIFVLQHAATCLYNALKPSGAIKMLKAVCFWLDLKNPGCAELCIWRHTGSPEQVQLRLVELSLPI